ncbi:MAG: hypothetical protein LDLANPLL_00056 [Turneriella sp.]|nr:hypothetical protein [Turneriella sp.]
MLRFAILFSAFAFYFCHSTSVTHYTKEENRRIFSLDIDGASHIVTLFPKTYTAVMGHSFSLVLLSPVLVADSILYEANPQAIIPYFNARGVSVWLVKIPAHTKLEKFAHDTLPQITAAIRKNSTTEKWVMGGISLGGQAVAYYLGAAKENAEQSKMQITSAFFLGTPFDYAYPGSFGERLTTKKIDKQVLHSRFLRSTPENLITPPQELFEKGAPVWSEKVKTPNLINSGVRLFFTAGKIDNVAPSESVYKFYVAALGDETKNSANARFLQPGRMNRYAQDYDHSMMLASVELANEVLPEILKWIDK